ncbi:DNA-binding response regulator [Tenacibaculum sp. 190524A02b]|uniref:DNA-binding response regulator, NarL/FixJ family, contains REC and HTH domains n=1 Tax=Tenacibaculum vairaonense TaxID=3137860 RepID=A0ABM9PMK1_9FLAO
MKKEKLTTLIINDYPLVCEVHKSAFTSISKSCKKYVLECITTNSCKNAIQIINSFSSKNTKSIDIAFLELKQDTSNCNIIPTSDDLAYFIRKKHPDCKIIISTTDDNKYKIHNIFKSINPDGLLIKKDISYDEFIYAIKEVINDPPYYSKSVLKLLRKKVSSEFSLDELDRKILYELSLGAKVKDMLNYIPLSVAAIEKRKRQLKKFFNIEEKGYRKLVVKAKENGFI